MKQQLLTIRMLLVVAMLCLGVNVSWADVTSYTWDFTNTTAWSTAKIATGSSVNLATDGEAPEGDEPYVTFTFDGADNYGAEVIFNAASKSVSGTCLWYAYNGSISSNNISIVVPGNMQATFSLKLGSNTRPTRYHLSNEAENTNHDISSGGDFVYRNTTGSSVTVTMWATNTRRSSSGNITLQNGIAQITLSEITYNYTINAVATIDNVETVVSTVATGKVAPSANYSAYVSRYVLHNGIYYELDDADNANLTGYQASYTMGSADEVKKINYKAATDVVFFSEWEKSTQSISNAGYYTSYENANYSGGWLKAVQGNASRHLRQAFTITDAGNYLIVMPYFNNNSSARQYVLYLDGTDEANKMETKTVNGSTGGTFSKELELTSGSHTVYLMENGATLTPQFDYLLIRKAPVTYTVQYKCGETTVKDADDSRTAVWGTTVAITDNDKETITYNNSVYNYVSDNASTQTIASDGTTVIVVEFVIDPIATAILDCKKYETSSDFATYIDGETYASAEEVYAAHTAWQIANATVTDGKLDVTKSILDAAVSEIGGAKWNNANVWDGSSWNEKYTEEGGAPDNNYFDVYENTITATQTIYGVPAGTYLIKAATRSAKDKGATGNLWVYDGENNIGNVNIHSDGNIGGTLGKGWSWTEMTVTLTETKNLQIGFYADASSSEAWAGCDDWHMYKVESAKSLNAKGYSTFSSSLNLQVTGADAYTAQLDIENSKITCTKIADGKIPAGSGVLLYGTENAEVTFTVIESAPALENNDLKATTLADGSLATMGNNTYYVLSGDTFMRYNGNAFAAGKAYFDPSNTQARSLTMTFENEMTGIGNVQETKGSKADGCYNLAGQRVSNPTKGLYIMNGKKFIVK